MVITIDGLGVNGKSTLAGMISKELNYKNFNTGAIYRCIALKIIEDNLSIDNIQEVLKSINNIDIDFRKEKVYLNGLDVTKKIRTEEVSFYSTKWATIPEIKEFVRNFQKEFISKNDTVMEGRDIATRIAPNAEFKFYLYSDFETRVKRHWKQSRKIDIDTIRNDLKARDDLDINCGNFIKPMGAIEIDTTNLSIEEVYEIMINKIRTK
jgi:cytidylate kinase